MKDWARVGVYWFCVVASILSLIALVLTLFRGNWAGAGIAAATLYWVFPFDPFDRAKDAGR